MSSAEALTSLPGAISEKKRTLGGFRGLGVWGFGGFGV